MADRPIADGLYTDGPAPRLIGGRRLSDGRITFPMPQGGEAAFYEPVELATQGTLWSWTVQRFRPKSPPYAGPEAFQPYPVGYVELPGEVIVETRLVDVAVEHIRTGMAMELAIVPFVADAAGGTVTTFAFRPAEGAIA
ncbi:Zn-ribbon domain-containing OB-fold protein [Sphingomonas profundi]|uniref:Zn-ribbon domain-containing OB-fold protein n=1 Tax=Alterirhizorhabdus profundi TaxID=2681549 RepID=UPI0012E95738|nr:OB-fold domain-containing protein [Sphingomonas profundi]